MAGRSGVREVRAQLAQLEAELEPFLLTRARTYRRLVPALAPDPETGAITCELAVADALPPRVALRPRNGRLKASCTCDYWRVHGQCKHLAAVVLELRERLSGAGPRLAARAVPGLDWAALRSLGSVAETGEAPVALVWQVALLGDAVRVWPAAPSGPPDGDGRPRPPRRLPLGHALRLVQDREPGLADDADRAVAEALLGPEGSRGPGEVAPDRARQTPRGLGVDESDPQALLAALTGHPRVSVVGRPGAVQVVAARAGLVVREAGRGERGEPRYDLRVAADGHPLAPWPGAGALGDTLLAVLRPADGALLHVRLDPDAAELLQTVAAEASNLPGERLVAFVDWVERSERRVPIDLPESLAGREVAASQTVSLLATPLPEGGAAVQPRVRPVPGGPPAVPGQGERRWGALVGGERLVAERDLAAEVRAARRVLEALGLMDPDRAADDADDTDDTDDADDADGTDDADDADGTDDYTDDTDDADADADADADTDADADAVPASLRLEDDERLLDLLVRFEARFGGAARGDGLPAAGDDVGAGDAGEPLAAVLEWPDDARPRRVVPVDSLRVEVTEGEDWLGLEGGLEAGDEVVSLAVLAAAARRGQRYVEVRRDLFVALERALAERLSDLALLAGAADAPPEADEAEPPALALPGAALAVLSEVLERLVAESGGRVRLPPTSAELLGRVRRLREAPPPPPPADLTAELRPYQLEGFRWLARLDALGTGGCLADEMGLGKTVQAIALLLHRRARGPALVVCPTSVLGTWARELARFAPAPALRAVVYRGPGRQDLLDGLGPGDVALASWGVLRRDVEWLSLVEWGAVVLDEAQAIKNGASQTARATHALARDTGAFVVALTGTPVENHPGELWSLFRAVSPGLLGSWTAFTRRFGGGADPARRAALGRLLRPFLLRRTKDEVLRDLPPRLEQRLDVELSTAERTVYERVRLDAVESVSSAPTLAKRHFRVLAAITRLRLAACHPRLVDPRAPGTSSKLRRLGELLDEVLSSSAAPGRRAARRRQVLVFSQFVRHLELARPVLDARGARSELLQGATPPAGRERMVAAFQAGELDALLVSLKAGGVGLNLTAADTVVHLDPWWNPAVEDQAASRAHRLGQDRPVTVVRLVARDTIEGQVLALHARKAELVDDLLAGADGAARVDVDELLELLGEGLAT